MREILKSENAPKAGRPVWLTLAHKRLRSGVRRGEAKPHGVGRSSRDRLASCGRPISVRAAYHGANQADSAGRLGSSVGLGSADLPRNT